MVRVNSENLQKEKERGVEKRLIGFELDERGIPRQGYDIVDGNGNIIGNVTSGTMSPSLGKGIGLGYVPTIFKDPGSKIYIQMPAHIIRIQDISGKFYF